MFSFLQSFLFFLRTLNTGLKAIDGSMNFMLSIYLLTQVLPVLGAVCGTLGDKYVNTQLVPQKSYLLPKDELITPIKENLRLNGIPSNFLKQKLGFS